MNYVLKTKDPMNGTWFEFIMLWTFQNPQKCNYFKSFSKHFKLIIFKNL